MRVNPLSRTSYCSIPSAIIRTPPGQRVRVNYSGVHDMLDVNVAQQRRGVCDKPAMAAPPHGLRKHDRCPVKFRKFREGVESAKKRSCEAAITSVAETDSPDDGSSTVAPPVHFAIASSTARPLPRTIDSVISVAAEGTASVMS
jgi:hypothetical protein